MTTMELLRIARWWRRGVMICGEIPSHNRALHGASRHVAIAMNRTMRCCPAGKSRTCAITFPSQRRCGRVLRRGACIESSPLRPLSLRRCHPETPRVATVVRVAQYRRRWSPSAWHGRPLGSGKRWASRGSCGKRRRN